MVQFKAVRKDFGDVTAIRGVSFLISTGGIVGLLGPNGAGKTTTMRIMTGFLEPSSGEVRIAGEVFYPDSVSLKRRIGYLPESAPSYGDMLAWDYLVFEARLHGLDPDARVPRVIREVGLESQVHKPIRELSKGFRQRVGLAHTLLHDPELLVLDEPTNGLDPNQIVEVRSLIRRIARTKTVLLSTHIMQEVEALCDRVIVIHEGTIRYDGSIAAFSGTAQCINLVIGGIDDGKLLACLRDLPGFRDMEKRPERICEEGLLCVSVVTEAERDLRPEIFRIAVENGFIIYEMVRERTSMEDIFHQLTLGQDIKEDEAAKEVENEY